MSLASRALVSQQENRRRQLVVGALLANQSRQTSSERVNKPAEKHQETHLHRKEANAVAAVAGTVPDHRPYSPHELAPSQRRILATMRRLHPTATFLAISTSRRGVAQIARGAFARPRRWRKRLPWGLDPQAQRHEAAAHPLGPSGEGDRTGPPRLGGAAALQPSLVTRAGPALPGYRSSTGMTGPSGARPPNPDQPSEQQRREGAQSRYSWGPLLPRLPEPRSGGDGRLLEQQHRQPPLPPPRPPEFHQQHGFKQQQRMDDSSAAGLQPAVDKAIRQSTEQIKERMQQQQQRFIVTPPVAVEATGQPASVTSHPTAQQAISVVGAPTEALPAFRRAPGALPHGPVPLSTGPSVSYSSASRSAAPAAGPVCRLPDEEEFHRLLFVFSEWLGRSVESLGRLQESDWPPAEWTVQWWAGARNTHGHMLGLITDVAQGESPPSNVVDVMLRRLRTAANCEYGRLQGCLQQRGITGLFEAAELLEQMHVAPLSAEVARLVPILGPILRRHGENGDDDEGQEEEGELAGRRKLSGQGRSGGGPASRGTVDQGALLWLWLLRKAERQEHDLVLKAACGAPRVSDQQTDDCAVQVFKYAVMGAFWLSSSGEADAEMPDPMICAVLGPLFPMFVAQYQYTIQVETWASGATAATAAATTSAAAAAVARAPSPVMRFLAGQLVTPTVLYGILCCGHAYEHADRALPEMPPARRFPLELVKELLKRTEVSPLPHIAFAELARTCCKEPPSSPLLKARTVAFLCLKDLPLRHAGVSFSGAEGGSGDGSSSPAEPRSSGCSSGSSSGRIRLGHGAAAAPPTPDNPVAGLQEPRLPYLPDQPYDILWMGPLGLDELLEDGEEEGEEEVLGVRARAPAFGDPATAILMLRPWVDVMRRHKVLDLEYDHATVTQVLEVLHDAEVVYHRDLSACLEEHRRLRDLPGGDAEGEGEGGVDSAADSGAASGAQDPELQAMDEVLIRAEMREQKRKEHSKQVLLGWIASQPQSVGDCVHGLIASNGSDLQMSPVRLVETLRPGLLAAHPDTWGWLVRRMDAVLQGKAGLESAFGSEEDARHLIEAAQWAILALALLAGQDLPLQQLRLSCCVATGFIFNIDLSTQWSDDEPDEYDPMVGAAAVAVDVFNFLTLVPPFCYVAPDTELAATSQIMAWAREDVLPLPLPGPGPARRDPQRQAHMAKALMQSVSQLIQVEGMRALAGALADCMRLACVDPRTARRGNRLYEQFVCHVMAITCHMWNEYWYGLNEDLEDEYSAQQRSDIPVMLYEEDGPFAGTRQRSGGRDCVRATLSAGASDFDTASGSLEDDDVDGDSFPTHWYGAAGNPEVRTLGVLRIAPEVRPEEMLSRLLPLAGLMTAGNARQAGLAPGPLGTAAERGSQAVVPSALSYMLVGHEQIIMMLLLLHGFMLPNQDRARLVFRPCAIESMAGGGAPSRGGQPKQIAGVTAAAAATAALMMAPVQLGVVPCEAEPDFLNAFQIHSCRSLSLIDERRVTATSRWDKGLKLVRQAMLEKKLGACWIQGLGLEGIQRALLISAQVASEMDAADMDMRVCVVDVRGRDTERICKEVRRLTASMQLMQALMQPADAAIGQESRSRIRELRADMLHGLKFMKWHVQNSWQPNGGADDGGRRPQPPPGENLQIELRLVQIERGRPEAPVLPLRAALQKKHLERLLWSD